MAGVQAPDLHDGFAGCHFYKSLLFVKRGRSGILDCGEPRLLSERSDGGTGCLP